MSTLDSLPPSVTAGEEAVTLTWTDPTAGAVPFIVAGMVAALLLSRTGAPRRHVTFMWAAWGVGTVLDIGLAISSAAWQMCAIAFFSFGFGGAGATFPTFL